MMSSFLVLVAVLDTAYVGFLFNQGRVDTLWPVKLLRVLVTALVTTFYPNMLEFVIFPFLCYITHHTRENLSWLMHNPGPGAMPVCEPFSTPEVFFTVPALLLACIFVALASYLSRSGVISFLRSQPAVEAPHGHMQRPCRDLVDSLQNYGHPHRLP
jgi:hypothetical protein